MSSFNLSTRFSQDLFGGAYTFSFDLNKILKSRYSEKILAPDVAQWALVRIQAENYATAALLHQYSWLALGSLMLYSSFSLHPVIFISLKVTRVIGAILFSCASLKSILPQDYIGLNTLATRLIDRANSIGKSRNRNKDLHYKISV